MLTDLFLFMNEVKGKVKRTPNDKILEDKRRQKILAVADKPSWHESTFKTSQDGTFDKL